MTGLGADDGVLYRIPDVALKAFTSQIIADCGISMGDEGKGRLIPEVVAELRESTGHKDPVGMVVKINGGANSGHTCGGLKLNLYPAGVVDNGIRTLGIGAGVVADPRKFLWEGAYIEQNGYDVRSRLLIDEKAMVSDLSHRLLDLAWEYYRTQVLGEVARGSTGRGISPAFGEETAHLQIFYYEFLGEREDFARKLTARLARAVRTIQHVCLVPGDVWSSFFDTLTTAELRANAATIETGRYNEAEFDFTRFRGEAPFELNVDAIVDTFWQAGQELRGQIGDVRDHVLESLNEGRYVIGEFGQSFWLDKRFGFTRSLTASHTYTPEFFNSVCVPVQPVHTIGVCKAYDTKVGNHVFITQMNDEHPLTVKLKKLEFGTSTGRQRMVGWYDAVEKGDALRYGGFTDLMINKLDALTYTGDWQGGELLICVGYRDAQGNTIKHVPRNAAVHATLRPIYMQLPGWEEDLSQVRHFNDLPANARRYVAAMVKSVLEVAYEGKIDQQKALPNLRYIGVGPDPSQIIKDVPETRDLIKLA